MEVIDLFEKYYVIIIFLIGLVVTASSNRKLAKCDMHFGVVILLVLALLFAISSGGWDKPYYAARFIDARDYYGLGQEKYNDSLWIYYQIFLGALFNKNTTLCFVVTALIYCLSYFCLGKRFVDNKYGGYFVLLTVGCLCFDSYGDNVIRQGVALACLLYAFSSRNRIIGILFCIIAVSFHKSTAIPLLAYIVSGFIHKTKWFEWLWLMCLVLSMANLNLTPFFESIGFIDNRVSQYIVEERSGYYSSGFRIDFILYSVAPILFVKYYFTKIPTIAPIYYKVYSSYLLVNALWLLVIRMDYTDRFAYLSWFMIPFLITYPCLNYNEKLRSPSKILLLSFVIFCGLTIVLAFKS